MCCVLDCNKCIANICELEVKLEDVKEMNYTNDDKDEQGRPCPRGEICVRGPNITLGYYEMADKTYVIVVIVFPLNTNMIS